MLATYIRIFVLREYLQTALQKIKWQFKMRLPSTNNAVTPTEPLFHYYRAVQGKEKSL